MSFDARRVGPVRAAVAALVLAAPAVTQAEHLRQLVRRVEADGVRTGCVVLRGGDAAVLFAHRAAETFLPASNLKLLTAVAALSGLGADYRFETRFRLEEGVLQVLAGGDPSWRTGGQHDPATVFQVVAKRLRDAGIEAVRGTELVAGVFGGPLRPPGWPSDQLQYDYCPPTGGLVLDEGCFRATISPGAGPVADIRVLAPLPLPVEGSLRMTSSRKKGGQYRLEDRGGELHASGWFYRKARPREVVGTVRDPAAMYEATLRLALARAGIAIDSAAPARDMPLLTYRTTLVEALDPMLRDSDNFCAEQVLRTTGAVLCGDGSFAGGTHAVQQQLAALLGSWPDGAVMVDGSGLSRDDRVTPRLLASALASARLQPWRATLVAALPRPGEGTLRRRFLGSPVRDRVRAKTGWIRGASALSGVVGDLVFAITMNYDPDRGGLNASLKATQEKMVEAMVGMENT